MKLLCKHLLLLFRYFSLFSVLTGMYLFSHIPIAYALGTQRQNHQASCPSSSPTTASLLVVLLDRSASLTAEPGATDPKASVK